MKLFALLTLVALQVSQETPKEAADAKVGRKVSMSISIDGKPATTPIIIGLFDEDCRKTTNNFFELCTDRSRADKKGNNAGYVNCPFHRIIPGFMIQGGDYTNRDGTGGESIYGNKFDDENFTVKHATGVLSMANAGKNTNGSQFFITTAETAWLDGKHTVFGRIVSGMETVYEMEKQGSQGGRPKTEVIITDCTEVPSDR